MKWRMRWIGPAAVALLSAQAGQADLSESRTIRQSFQLAPGGKVAVDNLYGSIRVTGTPGRIVEMVVVETIEADDQATLERARAEVELLIDSSDALLDLFVNGPFRDENDRGEWSRRRWQPRYQVHYDFELQVPVDAALDLKTITEGEIRVSGVRGDFEVRNVNGGIEMNGLAGSGTVRTVNGPVVLEFVASPGGASEFVTVNGDVDVVFPGDLSADLQLTTRFGELWSDFEVSALPAPPVVRETKRGKTILSRKGSMVRVADGGPILSFETLNGDVLIRRHDTR
jgi:hypothetical protein